MIVDWLITEMNILGGAETYVRWMAPLLRQTGCELRVVTFLSGGELVEGLRQDGVPVIELGARHKADLRALFRLIRLWRAHKPDLVHTHLFHAGLVGKIIARLMGIRRVVVHQHGAEQARSRWRSILDRLTSPLANGYIATCQAVADILRTRESIPASKIYIIFNGIEIPAVVDRQPATAGQPSPIVIACVGRLSPEKGQEILLEAVSRLGRMDIHIDIIGDGPLRAILEARAAQPDLAGRIALTGNVPHPTLLTHLTQADLFVLPSQWEGVSMALLEAMAYSLPVVATSVGGTPEVVIDGETGILVPPQNPAALAAAIARLLEDPDLRQQMGAAGRQRVAQYFDIRKATQQLTTLYEQLLTSRNRPTESLTH